MLRTKLALFATLAIAVLALDLYTKQRAVEFLPTHGATHAVIDGTFWIAHHRNTGGMWGVGQEWSPWILRVVRIGAVLVILMILAQTPASDRLSQAALGLVMGGAVGNIYDSLTFGYVRDFLQFHFGFPPFAPFPTFNVADSAICVGVGLLAIQMFRAGDDEGAPAETTAANP